MPGQTTEVERIAVVETKVDYLIGLMEAHVAAPACESCKLNDNVAVCENDLRWMKRIGYTVGSISLASIIGLVLDRIFSS